MTKNVFVSFAVNDKAKVDLLRGQASHDRLPLEFRDYSIKEPFESAWKTNCERILRMCSATICLVGLTTYQSTAVNWELEKSRELGLGLLAVRLDPAPLLLPSAILKYNVRVLPWDLRLVMDELNGAAA